MEKLGRSLLVVALCAGPAAHAQVYAGRGDDGVVVLSNFRSESADELLIAAPEPMQPPQPPQPPAAAQSPAVPVSARRDSDRFADLIQRVARETDLSPQLLHAVIAVESGYDVRAASDKGALGLMQLMPQTAKRFGVADPLDPAQNVAGGAAYLKFLLGRFNNDVSLALAAYNAGEGAVIKAGYRIPPYAETRAYVPRVLARLRRPSTLY